MVGKKKLAIIIASTLCLGLLSGCSSKEEENVKKVGIIQTGSHTALDESKKGFLDALSEKGYKDGEKIKVEFQNAESDISTANTIASQYVNDKKDLIFAIGTPVAQAAYNATKDTPIVITAVTDAKSAGLVESNEKPGTNVTGTSDNVSVEKQLELMKSLVPDAKKIGILYSTSEKNSEIQVNTFEEIATKSGYEVKKSAVTNSGEVDQGLTSILGEIDILYVPTDNTVASAHSLVAKKCLDKNVPFIGAEVEAVKKGALATVGIDYYQLGKEAGYKAVEILEGKKADEIPVEELKDLKISINTDAAKKLNIEVPEEIKKDFEEITGGVS